MTLSTCFDIFDPRFSYLRAHLLHAHFSKEGSEFWNHPKATERVGGRRAGRRHCRRPRHAGRFCARHLFRCPPPALGVPAPYPPLTGKTQGRRRVGHSAEPPRHECGRGRPEPTRWLALSSAPAIAPGMPSRGFFHPEVEDNGSWAARGRGEEGGGPLLPHCPPRPSLHRSLVAEGAWGPWRRPAPVTSREPPVLRGRCLLDVFPGHPGLRALGLWVVKQKPVSFRAGLPPNGTSEWTVRTAAPKPQGPEGAAGAQTCLGLTAGGQGLGSRWPLRDLASQGRGR